jgi:CBS-domain-containing membrane protein
MAHHTVRDVMTAEVVTVAEDTPFKDLAQTMASHHISALPVLDPRGRVTGVVSEIDLLRKEEYQNEPTTQHPPWWGHRKARIKAGGRVARDVMTPHPVTITPEASIVAAARTLDRHHVRRLVVLTADGWLAGVVTPSDLLKPYLRADEDIRSEILHDIITGYLGTDPHLVKIAVTDGTVTLGGVVENKSMIPLAVRMSHAVAGVIDVIDHLGYTNDDTHLPRAADTTDY